MQSGTKNPPWARSNVNTNMTGMNPQIMDPNAMAMTQQGIMPFQQTQAVFNPNMMQAQGGMAMQMAGQMQMNQMSQGQIYPGNVVAYPTPRAINQSLYQNTQNTQSQSNTEQRVFTGTVTKTHNDFGFVDHDVFYQTSVCAKGVIPKVNDRVLVEASFNANMPFKWNATRVQVIPKSGGMQQNKPPVMKSNSYNAVPPPMNKKSLPSRRDERPPRREERKRSRSRSRSRSRERRDSRSRRESPLRKRPVVRQPSPVKYVVRVPRIPLDISQLDVPALTQRYSNLYVPSDFFSARIRWGETFPPESPLSLNNPCTYHIVNRDMGNPLPNDAVLEPPDADYRFSAKVMLISVPTLESLYQKCGLTKPEDKDKHSSQKSSLHPTRLIKFLVGHKGKGGENFAIGGPWSPSLDGENPQSDPQVLVKTAVRTCKALTGIDLTPCTQWYRMVEFYYWREGSGGKSRLECVVLFLPDVWSAQPTRFDWTDVQERYRAACDAALAGLGRAQSCEPRASADPDISEIEKVDPEDNTITIDENDDDISKPEPTHYSKIDLKTIKVDQLREELRARNMSCKGLRPQLMSRLSKLIKIEEEKDKNIEDTMEIEDDDDKKDDPEVTEIIDDSNDKKDEKCEDKTEKKEERIEKKDDKKEDKKEKKDEKQLEKERATIKARYEIPNTPHIIVHPNSSAKGGKFNCNVATLSLLLDYRITDNKEHSFELFVFAELFNEMMMRDFGFYIYKTLYTLPEKVEDLDKLKTDKKDDKVEKKDDKVDKKDEKNDKKDDRKDDRRDSRRRERRESRSDDERSGSPKRGRLSRGVDLPPDPYLLLSLVYFDTSRCGYIIRKDLQNLFMSLGLQLSRSQIKNILEKVCVKDSFTYKSLTQTIKEVASGSTEAIQDLPLETTVVSNEVPEHITELEGVIASGNRELLPVFDQDRISSTSAPGETKVIQDGAMVMYRSRVVDVGATLAALRRSEQQRAKLEAAVAEARAVARTMRAAAAQTQAAARASHHQLADLRERLARAGTRQASLAASSKIFHSALKSIQSKVDAVVNIKYEEDDDVEIINGPIKSENEIPIEKIEENEKLEDIQTDVKEDEIKTDLKDDTKDDDGEATQPDTMEIEDKE